jgi:hypothetical protein
MTNFRPVRLRGAVRPENLRNMTRIAVALCASVLALLALPAAGWAQNCAPKTNLEGIIDDSGSMSFNDPNDLRIRAMELFIDTQGNERRTLGAVEFGSDATPLFGPGPIGQNASAFKSALNANLLEDGGGTDYNDAFALAGSHNPNATGRIFLTDGDHNDVAPYANGHAGGPPVYVIGLGAGLPGGPSDDLLRRIATDTGGLYRRADDPTALQAAMFELNAAIACQAPPRKYSDEFTRNGQTRSHTVKIPGAVKKAQFALTWANAGDRFTIGGFRILRHGKLVARGSAKRRIRRLKVNRRNGATFTTVSVRGLVRGKLRFKVKARRLSTPGVSTELTTQVTRRAR